MLQSHSSLHSWSAVASLTQVVLYNKLMLDAEKSCGWQALEHRSLTLTEMLERTYAISLAREALLGTLLQRIKQTYLGAQPAGGLQDMMSTMLQMFSGSQ